MKLSKKQLQELNKTHTTQFNIALPKESLSSFDVTPMISGKSIAISPQNGPLQTIPLKCELPQSTETILMLSIGVMISLLIGIYKKVNK